MNCNELRPLLEAYTDGELDLTQHLAVEAHLQGCPACAREAEASRIRRDALAQGLPRFTAPASLRAQLAPARPAAAIVAKPLPFSRFGWLWAAGLAAALMVSYNLGLGQGRGDGLVDEVVADHVRSLQASHLLDVVSTDRHTVKPWFAGKLDFSPPVVDLAEAGFPLAGGRLEQIDGRPAAALVFHRKLHAINVFVWLPEKPFATDRSDSRHGFQTVRWSQDGLDFIAVAEIPAADLGAFVQAFRQKAVASATAASGRE